MHVYIKKGQASMAVSFGEFVSGEDPDYEWLIPFLMEKQDRLILTGREGRGKSTLLRQFGVMGAAGLHPFTREPIEPFKSLYIDLESGPRHVRRKFKELFEHAKTVGAEIHPDKLWIECRPNGADLNREEDRQWLADQVKQTNPDLVIIGPLYKMVTGDPTSEEPAKRLSAMLDEIRGKKQCAFLIEAHSAKSSPGHNPLTPYGASLWMRWPEFGFFLGAKGEIKHWRGPRDERDWPVKLMWGNPDKGEWPWTTGDDADEILWNKIQKTAVEMKKKPTQAELARRIGVNQATISRCIGKNGDHYADWLNFTPQDGMNIGGDDDDQ